MKTLYLDLETYSEVPLKNGTHVYADKAEILLFIYAIDDQPAKVWDWTAKEPMPYDLNEALDEVAADEREVVAHNSHFDRTILETLRTFIVDIRLWRDTMVKAQLHALPGGLERLSHIFRLGSDKAKDKEGKALIQLFCKPRPKNMKLRRATRETHPAEWEKFKEYGRLDVEAMRAIDRKLPNWNYEGFDRELWYLDQEINDRGFLVDVEFADRAVIAANRRQRELATEVQDRTQGDVDAATQRDAMLKHILEAFGVKLPDMQKSTLERRLEDPDLPDGVKDLIRIRLDACTTSVSKYTKLLLTVSPDGRLRNTLKFAGAGRTRRWAGQLFQPQNLMRPDMPFEEIEEGIAAVKADCADLLGYDVMRLLSNALRSAIIASPGNKLVVSDLSNIEGRDQAWLAGEEWKLQAFRDFDAGKSFDLYVQAYARAFNVDPQTVVDNKKHGDGMMRMIGKVMELALGYEGGVGAFVTFAANLGIDLEKLAEAAYPTIPADIKREAQKAWDWAVKKKRTMGLEQRVYVTCDALKRLWRQAHPEISSYWGELKDAAIKAIKNKGVRVRARKVVFVREKNWLRCILPSGASLCYPNPKVQDGKISYMGMNQYTRQWQRIYTYGGKLFENICQSVARDIMAWNMLYTIKPAGYTIVLTVHDEVVTEAPDEERFNEEHLSELLATNPPWAPDIPLASAGFQGKRYKKE